MARAFRWVDALADLVEVGPVRAALVADQLETTPSAVLAGALSVPGAFCNPATGCVVLPSHDRRVALETFLSDLTYVIGNPSAYFATKATLRRRWARGNFSTPRDLGRRVRAWRVA